MEAIDTFDVEELSVEIHHDDTCQDFEDEFENDEDSAIIICTWEKTSSVSQHNPFKYPEDAVAFAKEHKRVLFDLWKYEHGNVAYRAGEAGDKLGWPFNCQFDSGQVGYMLVKEEATELAGMELLEFANNHLDYFSDWCNGNVYGFVIKNDDGEDIDSCWGFVGMDNVKEAATVEAHSIADALPKQAQLALGEG